MTSDHPVLLPPRTPSDLVSYALHNRCPAATTTLLICMGRSAFLDSLASAVHDTPESHLLHATLQQIVISRSINLVFFTTLSHLRAYLAVFAPTSHIATVPRAFTRSDIKAPLLLVYGLVSLHRDTSEWSAQGLGVTMASLVESGSRHGYRMVMCEELPHADAEMDGMDVDGEEENVDLQGEERHQSRADRTLWTEEMPILNGSTRRMMAGNDETSESSGWAGRTVPVGRVLRRWCVFQEE